jgi:hypothetical protein
MRNFTSTSTAVDMGVIGQSLKFDGSDDIVDIKTPASLLITNATISTRFKTSNAGSSYRGLITKARRFNVFLKDNKLAVFDWNVGDAYLSGGTYNDNKWHTVTVTFQTGVTNGSSIYVDGQFFSNFTWNVYASGDCYIAIGGQDTNCAGLLGSNFNGLLDDTRVWNRILSASEIKQIYNQGGSKVSSVISGLPSTGLNSGLLGYWTLDGDKINWATGAVLDSSGNNITGTTTNMSTTSSPTDGISGQGLYFDGVNDAVNLNKPSSMDFSGSSDFSLSLWVKPNHIAAYQCFLCKLGSLNPGGKGMMLGTYASETRFMFTVRDGTNSVGPVSASVPFGKWHHLTATYNASTKTAYLYVNSVRSSPNTNLNLGDSSDTSANLLIGDWVTNNSLYNGKGTIDEVRVYNRVLSDSEVSILYKQGGSKISSTNSGLPSTGLNSGLVGHWTFDGKDLRTNVTDRSGNSNTGYLQAFTSTSTAVTPGKIGQAINFSGASNSYINVGKNSSLSLGTGDFTISFWLNRPSDPAGYIFSNKFHLFYDNSSTIFTFRKSGGTETKISSLPTANKWVNVVIRRLGGTMTAYYDGVSKAISVGGTNNDDISNSTLDLYFGHSSNALKSKIDDVRIWNRALSISEIQQLYNQSR